MEENKNPACILNDGTIFLTRISPRHSLGTGEDSASRVRIREALQTDARVIAVTCLTCAKMLDDAVKIEGLDDRLEVLSVAEIVSRAQAR